MKVIIEKTYNPVTNERFFIVSIDGSTLTKWFSYKENVPETDIYNEETNYKQALDLAHRIEANGSTEVTKEIVYETTLPESLNQ